MTVRKEMLKDNYEQIDEYITRFVKEPSIKQILVVKSDGTIAVATDKKIEGTLFSSLFPQELMEQNEISLFDDKEGNIRIAAPIMGLDTKLGLLVMIYKDDKL